MERVKRVREIPHPSKTGLSGSPIQSSSHPSKTAKGRAAKNLQNEAVDISHASQKRRTVGHPTVGAYHDAGWGNSRTLVRGVENRNESACKWLEINLLNCEFLPGDGSRNATYRSEGSL